MQSLRQLRIRTSRDALWNQALEALDLAACLDDAELANAKVTFHCMVLEQQPTDRWLDFGEVEGDDLTVVLTEEFKRGFVARALRILGKRQLRLVGV